MNSTQKPAPSSCAQTLMVGFSVPEQVTQEICKVDRYAPIQTHKHSWAMIRGLEADGKTKVDCLSSTPISNYPANPRIFIRGIPWDRGNCTMNRTLPFINLLVFKHLTRFIFCFSATWKWLRQHKHQRKRILLMGVHSAHMYAVLAATRMISCPVFGIVTDPPGLVYPDDSKLAILLRKLDVRLIRKALSSMNGLIACTRALAKDLAPEVPALIQEGILADDLLQRIRIASQSHEKRCDNRFAILYSGSVHKHLGVDLLLEAFKLLKGDQFQLWITGKGLYSSEVESAAARDPRIKYWGFVDEDTLLRVLMDASVVVNPCPVSHPRTPHMFPSKTMDYLASGKPIVSTRLAGIPEEYFEYLQVLDPETPENLAAILKKLSELPESELVALGARGQKFAAAFKSEIPQGRRLREFLDAIS